MFILKQYFIYAFDATDDSALERRMAARPAHLVGAKALKSNGNFCLGGAILDDDGKMIGSVMILQFESTEEFEHWQTHEPYITSGVWDRIEIRPFRVAEV